MSEYIHIYIYIYDGKCIHCFHDDLLTYPLVLLVRQISNGFNTTTEQLVTPEAIPYIRSIDYKNVTFRSKSG